MIDKFDLGDIVEMKKQHPCGSKEFEVIRLGADIKIKCVGCGRSTDCESGQQPEYKLYRKLCRYDEDPDNRWKTDPVCA